ncbi:MAG: hypothetical protein IIT39_16350 [Clostridia bacterium]|nr:hypothetical protein [Clostridia bacterium]
MKTLKNELMEIAPERVQTLEKIRNALALGSVKDYTVDEQIEMSGVMAAAAAAFFFSDETENSELKAIRIDLYETAMEIAKYLVMDPVSKKLTGFLELWHGKNTWKLFEDAYIEYTVRKYRTAKGLDDIDVIGEYPPDDEGDESE